MRASLWFPLVVLMTPYLDPFLMSIPVVRQPHSTLVFARCSRRFRSDCVC